MKNRERKSNNLPPRVCSHMGCVAKTGRGTPWARRLPFLLGLGGHSQEAGDEHDLPGDVSFVHVLHLSFAHHVHHLLPLSCPPCRLKREEAHCWFDQPF